MRVALIAGLMAASLAFPAYAQDAAAGEKVFTVCRACHQIGPGAKNGIGPELNGVVGRKAGSVEGYNYSPANKNSGLTWTPEELNTYLENPQGVVHGTKMAFAGVKDATQRKNLIAYLAQFGPDGQKKTQ
ncbi:MAG: cytochrome c family protein [Acetobacteraceae bacterium]|nr:cytochrome c family protein [Acetobacteraceae bacterium]MBV8523139.1 cytochrome c family protein [Acetobacteraceae bacterium]